MIIQTSEIELANIIYEYESVGNLEEYIKQTKTLQPYFRVDFEGLKARQYCGIINDNQNDFYILPKITKDKDSNRDLKIFTYMLLYANDIKLKNEDVANAQNHKSDNILEAFIEIFANNLFKELQKGIYKTYITQQENITTLRGKYLINENLKHNFTHHKIYCEFDEFSPDNRLNQFLLYAIKSLMRFTKNKKRLKQCELILDEVEYCIVDIKNINIHFDRLNSRFKKSFDLAILLLNKSMPLFEKDKRSFAFLFDMNILFEKFISKLYKSIDSSTKIQYKESFGNLTLKPDIYRDNLIIDVKYKIPKNKKASREDKYQMFVYGTNFGIQNTMLLYPQYKKKIEKDFKLGEGDEKMINLKIRSIDLNFEGDYDGYIEEIKKRLENLR